MVSGPDRPASDKIPSLSIFAIVMLAPLPFGSVGPIPIVTWCIVLGVALSLTSLCSLDRRHIGVLVCVDRDHAHRLIRVMAWCGTTYAVYGIAAFFIDPTRVLWEKKEAYFTVLTSTFINRNTAAVYFGSCVILWLLILLDRLRRNLP